MINKQIVHLLFESKLMLGISLVIFVAPYILFLNKAPIHLNQDELGFSLNAYSVAKTGFDENGRFLPFYFWHLGVMWATPIIVYLTAIFLKVLPLSEIVIRLPSVLVETVNLVLIYFIAKKLFKSRLYGLVAALLLALTPAHFIHSRILLDNLFIVPFILGWFYLILLFMEKRRLWLIFFAAFLLGLGVHSYHAAKVIMPLYLIITLLTTLPFWMKKIIILAMIILGFALPLLPLIPWLVQYPDTLTDQIRYTGLYNTNLNPLEGITTLIKKEIIFNRLAIWLSYFNPKFLFLSGDVSLIHSTQKVGVFLLPFVILVPFGIYQMFRSKLTWFGLIIIVGFLTAPVAAALVGNQYRISKALIMLPFACLMATYGIQYLFSFKNGRSTFTGIILLTILGVQFVYFANDYFSGYRIRSYSWFNYNIPGALEALIEQDKVGKVNKIYLDSNIYFIDKYWKFYLIKNHREDILSKTFYIHPENVNLQLLPANSLLVYRFDHLANLGQLNRTQGTIVIKEPDDFVSFYIFRN